MPSAGPGERVNVLCIAIPYEERKSMTITYLVPVQEPDVIPASLAPRLRSLEGATIGLLSNGKTNAAELLDLVADQLGRRVKLGGVLRADKRFAGINCPPGLLDELAAKCDAVITAIGD